MRIKIGDKYICWNKPLEFGEDTDFEDLWNAGYEFQLKSVLCFRYMLATKR